VQLVVKTNKSSDFKWLHSHCPKYFIKSRRKMCNYCSRCWESQSNKIL